MFERGLIEFKEFCNVTILFLPKRVLLIESDPSTLHWACVVFIGVEMHVVYSVQFNCSAADV